MVLILFLILGNLCIFFFKTTQQPGNSTRFLLHPENNRKYKNHN